MKARRIAGTVALVALAVGSLAACGSTTSPTIGATGPAVAVNNDTIAGARSAAAQYVGDLKSDDVRGAASMLAGPCAVDAALLMASMTAAQVEAVAAPMNVAADTFILTATGAMSTGPNGANTMLYVAGAWKISPSGC